MLIAYKATGKINRHINHDRSSITQNKGCTLETSAIYEQASHTFEIISEN